MRKFFIVFLCILGVLHLSAQDFEKDRIEFSLLTCSPSTEVYALYGHTAIRYHNATTGDDWAFNYGVFDFGAPNFVWRFVKGECDYQLGVIPYYYMEQEYRQRGSAVYAQVLNLTAQEKERLFDLLMTNYQPENRVYRYNFLYDNCTTRARDRIEEAVEGEIHYPEKTTSLTYRQIIHQYTQNAPWAEVGQDLCLGQEADEPLTQRQEMFAPFYLKDYFSGAAIRSVDGNERPLVLREETLVPLPAATKNTGELLWRCLTPGWVAFVLLVVVLFLGWLQLKQNKIYWGVDLFTQLTVGLMGCIVTILFFFSVHPTVGSNWQILLFNPLPLFLIPWTIGCAVRRKRTFMHVFYAVWMVIVLVTLSLISQKNSMPSYVLACILLIRSIGYILYYKKNKN